MATSLPIPPRDDLLLEVFHGSSDGLAIASLNGGGVVEANEAFTRLVGRPRQDVVGNTLANLRLWLDPQDEARFESTLRERGRVDIFDTELRLPDGGPRAVVLSAEIVDGGRESLIHLRVADAAHRMTTAPKYRELRESDRLYRSLVETIPAVVYVDRPDEVATNIYTSPQTTEMFGYTPEDWERDPELWAKLIHPDDHDRVMAANVEHDEVGAIFDEVYRCVCRDGRVIWVRDVAVIVGDDDGKPLYSLGFLFDITDQKEAEARLEETLGREHETAEQLRALDQLKNTMLHTLSHDLKAPLAGILAGATTLARPGVGLSEDERREMLLGMASRARKMDSLLTNLLDLDRLDRGIVAPVCGPVEIDPLLEYVVGNLDERERARVTAEPSHLTAIVDAAKFERIVDNLLANAVRHTPEDTPIRVSVGREGSVVHLVVEDEGPGVPEELKQAIFEPFRRGEGTESVPGTGIGLSLVARFAELHGGRAWVEDREDGGASFHVRLAEGQRTF